MRSLGVATRAGDRARPIVAAWAGWAQRGPERRRRFIGHVSPPGHPVRWASQEQNGRGGFVRRLRGVDLESGVAARRFGAAMLRSRCSFLGQRCCPVVDRASRASTWGTSSARACAPWRGCLLWVCRTGFLPVEAPSAGSLVRQAHRSHLQRLADRLTRAWSRADHLAAALIFVAGHSKDQEQKCLTLAKREGRCRSLRIFITLSGPSPLLRVRSQPAQVGLC